MGRTDLVLGWCVLFVALVAHVGHVALADPPSPPLTVATATSGLGVNIHFTDARPGEMEMLAASGVCWVRMDFTWSATERERGVYDFSAYDRLVASLAAHNIRALFILDYSNRLYERERSVSTEEGRTAFARWAAAATEHFRGRGVVWEIWNEPNIRNFWQPEPNLEDYTALAKRTCEAIRAVAPREVIVGPATSTIDLEFLEGCFQAGLLEFWDAVSVHPYRRSGPESAAAEYQALRQLIGKYAPAGKSIPIISGEWGYSAAWHGFDADLQGKLLPREWLTNVAHGIPLSIWYDWHDDGRDPEEPEHHFGMVRFPYQDGRAPVYDAKPAYLAAQTITSRLRDFRFVKRVPAGGPDDYALLFAREAQRVLVIWTTASRPHTLTFASSPVGIEAVSHLGELLPRPTVTDDALTLTATDAPRYLTAETGNARWDAMPELPRLRVRCYPGLGNEPVVSLENQGESPFQGRVQLIRGLASPATSQPRVRPVVVDEAIELSFSTGEAVGGRMCFGAEITDPDGQQLYDVRPTCFTNVPRDALRGSQIVPDGNPEVASRQVLTADRNPERDPDGPPSAWRVDYEFGSGWKFLRVVPGAGRLPPMEERPRGFGMWIHGNGSGISPRVRIRDASGQTWQPTGPTIDWQGWQFVEFPWDASAGHWGGDGTIQGPLVWDTVLLLDNTSRQPNEGTIYFTPPVIIHKINPQ